MNEDTTRGLVTERDVGKLVHPLSTITAVVGKEFVTYVTVPKKRDLNKANMKIDIPFPLNKCYKINFKVWGIALSSPKL